MQFTALMACVVCGVLSGTMAMLPVANTLATMPLFYAALAGGISRVKVAAGVGILTVLTLGGMDLGVLYGVGMAGPALFLSYLAWQTRENEAGKVQWFPSGLLLAWLVGLGLVVLGLLMVVSLNAPGGWEGVMRQEVQRDWDQALSAMFSPASSEGEVNADSLSPPDAATLESLKPMTQTVLDRSWALPGLKIGGWMLLLVAASAMAERSVTRRGWLARPPLRWSELIQPRWVKVALVGALALAAVAAGSWRHGLLNAAMILAVPSLMAGMAVVHKFAASRLEPSARPIFLVAFYIVALYLTWPMALVVGLGFAEEWVGFRRRFAAAGAEREIR